MARYDLPAMVNFVVNETRQKQLYYIGHSQGTLTAFAHASQDAQFAKQVGSSHVCLCLCNLLLILKSFYVQVAYCSQFNHPVPLD